MARWRAKWALIIALLIAPVVFAAGVVRAALAGTCTEIFIVTFGGRCLFAESIVLLACLLAAGLLVSRAQADLLLDMPLEVIMFDRFTDRARKVMGYARQEAERLKHDYIGTEHILLGIVKEGSGLAATVLENLGIDLEKVRAEVERRAEAGSAEPADQLPFSKEARRVLEASLDAASLMGHKYVGTEHVLLGLLRVERCVAAEALASLGLSLEAVRHEVTELLGGPADAVPGTESPEPTGAAARVWQQEEDIREAAEKLRAGVFARLVSSASPAVVKAVEYAVEEAERAGAAAVDLAHLRAGLERAERESGEKST